jgi:hypothetical protein
MDDFVPTQELQLTIRAAIAAPPSGADFARQLRRTVLQHGREIGAVRRARMRLAWGAALVLLISAMAGILIAGPQNVVSALQKLFGYLPGIGIVEPGIVRVLAEPVIVERGGITVTLEKVVADSTHTTVVYTAEGISAATANSNGTGGTICGGAGRVHLPDGTDLAFGGGGGWGGSSAYQYTLKFAAFPTGVNDAEFLIPCLMEMTPGQAPEDWRIPFRLAPAPADMTLLPVEVITVPASDADQTPAAMEVASSRGITLSLEKAVALEDGYLLTGRLVWDSTLYSSVLDDMTGWTLTDSDGMDVPFTQQRVLLDSPVEPGSYPWELKTKSKSFRAPLRLSMESAKVMLAKPVVFSFDPGSAPLDGKQWTVNRDLEVLGLPVRILSGQFLSQTGRQGLEFAVRADPGIASLNIGYGTLERQSGFDNPDANSSSDSRRGPEGTILADAWAEAKIIGEVKLSIEQVSFAGPWVAVWNPATAGDATVPSPAAMYGVILSLDKVIELEDGYVLIGSMRWTDPRIDFVSEGLGLWVTDADGNPIPAEWDSADIPVSQVNDPNTVHWAYRIQGKPLHGPLTLSVASVIIGLTDPVPLSFDTGPDPIVRETWDLERELDVLGMPVRFHSAKMISEGVRHGFTLNGSAPSQVLSLQLDLENSPGMIGTPAQHNQCEGGGSGIDVSKLDEPVSISCYVMAEGPIAGGQINLSVKFVTLAGNWKVVWNPPAVLDAQMTTPMP